MGLIQKLKYKTVFLDTAPLIYYIEENKQYSTILNRLFLSNSKGEFLFHTSVITLLEVLVHPMRENEYKLVEQYQNILCNSPTKSTIMKYLIKIAIGISRERNCHYTSTSLNILRVIRGIG